jgi:hypothetical protein
MISIRISYCSPDQLKVRPRVEPDQVKVEGPGVSGKGIPASLPAEFTIDTSQAGYGDLEVQVKVSYRLEQWFPEWAVLCAGGRWDYLRGH